MVMCFLPARSALCIQGMHLKIRASWKENMSQALKGDVASPPYTPLTAWMATQAQHSRQTTNQTHAFDLHVSPLVVSLKTLNISTIVTCSLPDIFSGLVSRWLSFLKVLPTILLRIEVQKDNVNLVGYYQKKRKFFNQEKKYMAWLFWLISIYKKSFDYHAFIY